MKEFKVSPENPQAEIIEIAAKVLEVGGIVVYPTETVYGIGANILEPNAIQRVFEVKQRSADKPSSIAFRDIKAAEKYVQFSGAARKLAEKFLPGPLTIILNTKLAVSQMLGGEKVGVRIPANEVARALLERVKFPITSTSANVSGQESASNIQDAIRQLGDKVDVFLDAGPCKLSKPSTIVDMSDGNFEVLREGAIPKEEIERFLK